MISPQTHIRIYGWLMWLMGLVIGLVLGGIFL